jgi:hypothetical protein
VDNLVTQQTSYRIVPLLSPRSHLHGGEYLPAWDGQHAGRLVHNEDLVVVKQHWHFEQRTAVGGGGHLSADKSMSVALQTSLQSPQHTREWLRYEVDEKKKQLLVTGLFYPVVEV